MAVKAKKPRRKKDGTPWGRTGPAKGCRRPEGAGRKPFDWRQAVKDRIWSYVLDGLSGEPVAQAGPTGKQIRAPLSQDNQIKLLSQAWRKLEPDLSAQAIQAEITDATNNEPVDNRQLARVIANILSHAQVDEEQPRPTYVHPSEKAQLLIGRDAVIEVSAGQPEAAPSAPVGFHGEERKDNRAVMPSSGPKVVRQMPRKIR